MPLGSIFHLYEMLFVKIRLQVSKAVGELNRVMATLKLTLSTAADRLVC